EFRRGLFRSNRVGGHHKLLRVPVKLSPPDVTHLVLTLLAGIVCEGPVVTDSELDHLTDDLSLFIGGLSGESVGALVDRPGCHVCLPPYRLFLLATTPMYPLSRRGETVPVGIWSRLGNPLTPL